MVRKTRKIKDKWKEKKWITVLAPDSFNNIPVAYIPITDDKNAVGRVVEVTLFDILKGDPSQHQYKIFFQKLEIPHRVVLLSSGDIGKISAKTYDLEVWMAVQNAYREAVSCSNCLDYQSRRLKIRFRDKTNEETQYAHTLNSTLVATERTMVAILENFQTKDGHVNVPNVLQKYMGKKII